MPNYKMAYSLQLIAKVHANKIDMVGKLLFNNNNNKIMIYDRLYKMVFGWSNANHITAI